MQDARFLFCEDFIKNLKMQDARFLSVSARLFKCNGAITLYESDKEALSVRNRTDVQKKAGVFLMSSCASSTPKLLWARNWVKYGRIQWKSAAFLVL